MDSGASMQMVSKKDLNSAELETMRITRSPTTVMTANGEVQTREEATENVKELDLFVTVMLLEETPAVLSLGKLCEGHGCNYHWTNGQNPHLTQNGKTISCNLWKYVPFVVPGLPTSSSTASSPTSSTSSWKDPVIGTENPAAERSGSVSEELRGNPVRRSIETKKQKKWRTTKKYKVNYCMICRTGWWKCSWRATGKPVACASRHCQFFSWITNGVASKSGTGLG